MCGVKPVHSRTFNRLWINPFGTYTEPCQRYSPLYRFDLSSVTLSCIAGVNCCNQEPWSMSASDRRQFLGALATSAASMSALGTATANAAQESNDDP